MMRIPESGLQLALVRTESGLADLEQEWNALLRASISDVPFLRHEFITAWWQLRGGGEWPEAELYLITARTPSGELIGIAPLFLSRNPVVGRALMLIGTREIADYLDLICPPQWLEPFLAALLTYLKPRAGSEWEVLDLHNLLSDSPSVAGLERGAVSTGWTAARTIQEPAPCIRLPGDWETYLAGLPKKQRHEIRRKMRRLEAEAERLRWYIVRDPEALDTEIKAALELMAFDPLKRRFLHPAMADQMRALMQAAFAAGWLQLAVLEVDGERAAAYINFDHANRIWSYNSGWDPRFARYSPGWVLLGYLLRQACADGRHAFDFLHGQEEYKYRFGGQDRELVRLTIRAGGDGPGA